MTEKRILLLISFFFFIIQGIQEIQGLLILYEQTHCFKRFENLLKKRNYLTSKNIKVNEASLFDF